MDPYSIFVNNLPKDVTYGNIKGALWPYQQYAPLQSCKKEKFIIITFQNEDAVQKIINDKDHITIKGKPVSIEQSYSCHIHLPPSFRLLIEVLFPPPPLLLPAPPTAPALAPPTPTYQHQHLHQHRHMNIPSLKDFLIFIISSFMFSLLLFSCFT